MAAEAGAAAFPPGWSAGPGWTRRHLVLWQAVGAGDMHHVAELLEYGLNVNVLVRGPPRLHLPGQGPESQLVACRDEDAAVCILIMLLDAGRDLFTPSGDSAAATLLQMCVQHHRLALLRAAIEHPCAWRLEPVDPLQPRRSVWSRVEALVVALTSVFHVSDPEALSLLMDWVRRLHIEQRMLLDSCPPVLEDALPEAVRLALRAAGEQRGSNPLLVAALAKAQAEAGGLAVWAALEAKYDRVICMTLGAVLACAPSIAVGGLMASAKGDFGSYLPWGDEPRRAAPGRAVDGGDRPLPRSLRARLASGWRALLAVLRSRCRGPPTAEAAGRAGAAPRGVAAVPAEEARRRAGVWQVQLARMLEAALASLPPAWRAPSAMLAAAMQQLDTLGGVGLSLVPWAPEIHRACSTPCFAAAAQELCRLTSGYARQAGGAELPALPPLAMHRIMELAAPPWSDWLLAALAYGERPPLPAPLIAPRMLCSYCFAAAADGSRLKRCSRCRVARYCSKSCQQADWPSHRKRCRQPPGLLGDVGAALLADAEAAVEPPLAAPDGLA